MSRKFVVLGALAVVAFAGGWYLNVAGGASGAGDGVQVVMYQNPACGCCGKWAAHMRRAGFELEIHRTNEVNRIKEREGITARTASCHTALIEGYVVEGHVPSRDVERMLQERPDIIGLTVPGMPMGAPGMEGDYRDSYDVLALNHDGTTTVYASY